MWPSASTAPANDSRSVTCMGLGTHANVRCRRPPGQGAQMDFEIPPDIQSTLDALDDFIEREIKPLEQSEDNVRFFDHRREYARTDFEHRGVPRREWEE